MASSKQVVGNPTPRVEGESKVTGKAVYAVDVTLPGLLWGKVLRSPISYGRIKRIDASRARQIPGAKTIITGEDVAGLRIGRRLYDMPILADGVVRFIGEKVAAVLDNGVPETQGVVKLYTKPFAKGDHEALGVQDFRLAKWRDGKVATYEDAVTKSLSPADFKK